MDVIGQANSLQNKTLEEVTGLVVGNYNLEKDKNIKFMVDYSEFLIKYKKYDEKIFNWQAENTFILKPLGLDVAFLKKKMEEKNKKYYKYDSLINQITYRLEKHGKLAPTKEIGRKFDSKELEKLFEASEESEDDGKDGVEVDENVDENMDGEENVDKMDCVDKIGGADLVERGEKISAEKKEKTNTAPANELNYYDLNDSFINDEEVMSDNSENEFCKITLQYGNHSEDAIIKNLERSKKLRKNLNVKNKGKTADKKLSEEDIEMNTGHTGLLSSSPGSHSNNNKSGLKRKFNQMSEENEHISESNNDVITTNTNNMVHCSEGEKKDEEKASNFVNPNSLSPEDYLEYQLKQVSTTGQKVIDSKEKVNLVKKLINIFKKVQEDETKFEELFSKIKQIVDFGSSENLNNELKILFEFEIRKIKREGSYSNLAKQFNQFVFYLTEISVRNITDTKALTDNLEINEKLNSMSTKFTSYIETVQSVCDYLETNENGKIIEQFYNPNKIGKLSIKEGKDKILAKMKEILEKHQLTYDEFSLTAVFNRLIDPTGNALFFDLCENNIDINAITPVKNKPNKSKKKKLDTSGDANKESIEVIPQNLEALLTPFNKAINAKDIPEEIKETFTSPQTKKKSKVKKPRVKKNKSTLAPNNNLNVIDLESNDNEHPNEPKTAFMSRRFYIKQFDPNDFQ